MDDLWAKALFAMGKDWVWGIDCPRTKAMIRVIGKKKPQPAKYTAFVANEHMIGTYWYCSSFVDGDDYVQALQTAGNNVALQMAQKKIDHEKERNRNK